MDAFVIHLGVALINCAAILHYARRGTLVTWSRYNDFKHLCLGRYTWLHAYRVVLWPQNITQTDLSCLCSHIHLTFSLTAETGTTECYLRQVHRETPQGTVSGVIMVSLLRHHPHNPLSRHPLKSIFCFLLFFYCKKIGQYKYSTL